MTRPIDALNYKSSTHGDTKSFFKSSDPIIPSIRQIAPGRTSCFGDTDTWYLETMGVRPNVSISATVINLDVFTGDWSLLVRTFLMCQLNPRHHVLTSAGIFLRDEVPAAMTVVSTVTFLRQFVGWAMENQLTPNLDEWNADDVLRFLEYIKANWSPDRAAFMSTVLKRFGDYDAVMPSSFRFEIKTLPYPRTMGVELKTRPLDPDVFWTLIHNCWAYISVCGPDIVRAVKETDLLTQPDIKKPKFYCTEIPEERFQEWERSKTSFVPVHGRDWGIRARKGEINWKETIRLVGQPKRGQPLGIVTNTFKKRIQTAINRGVPLRSSIVSFDMAEVEWNDGVRRPWKDGFDRKTLTKEAIRLRNITMVFTLALSMMRAGEVLSLKPDCLGTQYGAPVLHGRVYKHESATAGRPAFWWVSEPVVHAIKQLSELKLGDGALFADPLDRAPVQLVNPVFKAFESHMEELSDIGILPPLRETGIRPHRLRRTMAIITGNQPDGLIALGVTLQHNANRALANSVTEGYHSPNDAWAEELKLHKDERSVAAIAGDWSRSTEGGLQVLGKGASRYRKLLKSVGEARSSKAKRGDSRLRRNLLRDAESGFELGTLCHCLGDLSKAECVKALPEETKVSRTIPSLCNPAKCSNAVITDEHLPLWEAEAQELRELLKDKSMAPNHRERLERQLKEIESITQQSDRKNSDARIK